MLVGMIELQLGSFDRYYKALKPLLEHWNHHLENYKDGDRDFDKHELYKTCAFVGLGPWDLLTMTLTTKRGLGMHFSFIGHTQGQSYFYAHDSSMVLLTKEATSKEKKAINKLADISRRVGLSVIRDDWKDHKGFKPLNDGLRNLGALWQPLSLKHINGGIEEDELWPGQKLDIQPKREDELVGLYQFKLNQQLWLQQFTSIHNLAYLVALAVHEDEEEYRPRVFRPFFCDGYFDLLILVRSSNLAEMDSLIKRIKYMNIGKTRELLGKVEIDDIVSIPNEIEDNQPLFEITHSTIGFPDALRRKCLSIWQVSSKTDEERLSNFDEVFDPLNIHHPNPNPDKDGITCKVVPSTRVMINTGKTCEVLHKLEELIKVIPQDEKCPMLHKNAENEVLHYGAHDLTLFPNGEVYPLGRYIARIQFFQYFISPPDLDEQEGQMSYRNALNLLSMEARLGIFGHKKPNGKEQKESDTVMAGPRNDKYVRSFTIPGVLSTESLLCLLRKFKQSAYDPRIDAIRELSNLPKEGALCGGKKKHSSGNMGKLHIIPESSIHRYDWWKSRINYLQPEWQGLFRDFLNDFFVSEVTRETLDTFFIAFCAIEGALSDPLRYTLFLDVRLYLENVFLQMLTLISNRKSDGNAKEVHFYDVEKEDLVKKESERGVVISLEAFFLGVSDLISKVFSQRTPGCFPYHDRSYARLSDLRTFHTKKLVSTSWLTNDIIQNITSLFRNHPSSLDLKSLKDGSKWYSNTEMPAQHYLSYFSNSPESYVSLKERSLSLSSKHLANPECLTLLFHEVGHTFSFVLRTPKLKNSLQEKLKQYDEIADYVWDEVVADLHVFRFCFLPFQHSALLDAKWGDINDHFMASWIFQLIQLPKPRTEALFEQKTLLRLMVGYGVAALGNNGSVADVLIKVRTFFTKKLKRFFEGLSKQKIKNLNLMDDMSLWYRCGEFAPGLTSTVKNFLGEYVQHRKEIPLFQYAFVLSNPNLEDVPCAYFKPMLGQKPDKMDRFFEAIFDELPPRKNSTDHFAITAQVAGLINLYFVKHSEKVQFTQGFAGFNDHTEQMRLSRLRQLATVFLLNGGTRAMQAYQDDLQRKMQEAKEADMKKNQAN